MALYTDLKTVDATVTDAKAINNAIRNILFTPLGSMPGKPTFGSNIYKIIFSQLDHITENLLIRYIKEALRKWEQRIDVESVTVQNAPEFNKVIVTIEYSYKDKGIEINEKLSLNLLQ